MYVLVEAALIAASLTLVWVLCELKREIVSKLSIRITCATPAEQDTVMLSDRRIYAGDVSGILEEEKGRYEEDCPVSASALHQVPQVV